MEDYGIENELQVYKLSNEDLTTYLKNKAISESNISFFIKAMTLQERNNYKKPPRGFKHTDIEPWRAGRRLSLLFKPITIANEKFIISPFHVREAFGYVLKRYYESTVNSNYVVSDSMQKWCGSYSSKVGTNFNSQVANRFIELGWHAVSDVNVTHLLRSKTNIDYGDVDVVAYNTSYNALLLLECKYLDICRNPGEIAKQLHEFRGEVHENNGRDRLKKHLDRMAILEAHTHALSKYIENTFGVKITKTIHRKYGLVFSNTMPLNFYENRCLENQIITTFDRLEQCSQELTDRAKRN